MKRASKTAAIVIETKSKISVEDFLGHPERVDSLTTGQVKELALEISKRSGQIRDVESRILYRFLCDNNLSVKSDHFPRLLNAKQIADQLTVPETWVREQARLGKLPSKKLGHYVRFVLDDVKAYLDEIANPPTDYKAMHITADFPDQPSIRPPWPPPITGPSKSVTAEIIDVASAWTTLLRAHVTRIFRT